MGELAFAHLVRRGAVGVVLNGCVRDVEQLEGLDLPLAVFALGTAISTVAGFARIIDVGSTVYIGGIRIETGDLVAGCRGGVVAAPWADRARILAQAREIGESDRQVRDGMARGESMTQLWTKHK
jgi:4-hydroxy-4-methyl-2-oxoglutarate aldolase